MASRQTRAEGTADRPRAAPSAVAVLPGEPGVFYLGKQIGRPLHGAVPVAAGLSPEVWLAAAEPLLRAAGGAGGGRGSGGQISAWADGSTRRGRSSRCEGPTAPALSLRRSSRPAPYSRQRSSCRPAPSGSEPARTNQDLYGIRQSASRIGLNHDSRLLPENYPTMNSLSMRVRFSSAMM